MGFLKKFLVYAVIYIVLIAVFLGTMTLAASLPRTKKFNSWMRRSSLILMKGGEYPESNRIIFDHYVDSLILNVACSFDPESPLTSAIKIYHYGGRKEMTSSFSDSLNGNFEGLKRGQYGRYWFGQSAVMKFLHYFWDLSRIHTLLGSAALFLLLAASVLVYEKAGGWYAAGSLFVVAALCNFQVFFQSLQFPPVFLIGFIGLLCLLMNDKMSWRMPVFFVSGMLTAFFDLLTAPLLAFGIPALIICRKDTVQVRSEPDIWKNWLRIWCGYPAVWLAGYVLSWGTKLILDGFATGDFHSTIQQFFLRIGTSANQGTRCSRLDALGMNFRILLDNTQMVFGLICIMFVILLIWHLIQWKRHKEIVNIPLIAGYLFLASMPFAVILLMANHTYIHGWMTYRGLSLTFASLLMMLTAFQPAPEEKKID